MQLFVIVSQQGQPEATELNSKWPVGILANCHAESFHLKQGS